MATVSRTTAAPGVFAKHQIEDLITKHRVSYPGGAVKGDVDPSALDLTVGRKAWKVREGLRPTARELDKITRSADEHHPTQDGTGKSYFDFSAKQIYVVELQERLQLPPNISGRATGKSTVGRLDVITHLLTSDVGEYDTVPESYEGNLFLLLSPQTFDIRVAQGASLNQLRFYCGPHYASIIDRQMIEHYGQPFWYIAKPDNRDEYEDWENIVSPRRGSGSASSSLTTDPHLFDLTVDLGDPSDRFIYKARLRPEESLFPIIDLGLRGYDPSIYFEREPVLVDGPDRFVVLETGSFYIMKSRERLSVPRDVAIEVVAISERIGDIRISITQDLRTQVSV
jgi:dCTP deaminase